MNDLERKIAEWIKERDHMLANGFKLMASALTRRIEQAQAQLEATCSSK